MPFPSDDCMIIVSACLAGENCRWNGKNKLDARIRDMVKRGEAVAACSEVLANLPIPREPCSIFGGCGEEVLNGRASVRSVGEGKDLTVQFLKGAEEFLKIARSQNVDVAILSTPSPSCGCGKTWKLDENLVNSVFDGDGVTAALLKRNGIKVFASIE